MSFLTLGRRNLFTIFVLVLWASTSTHSWGHEAYSMEYESRNFNVYLLVPAAPLAANWNEIPPNAKERADWAAHFVLDIADHAERARNEIAQMWSGRRLADWRMKVPIRAELSSENSGETVYKHAHGAITHWDRMVIKGSPKGILRDVLPHEVTHAFFADYFGGPVPRWVDEGAAMLSERRDTQSRWLAPHLDRLIAGVQNEVFPQKDWNQQRETSVVARQYPLENLLAMKEYPVNRPDVVFMYAQSSALVRFLVDRSGPRELLRFLSSRDHNATSVESLAEYYRFKDVTELKEAWLDWLVAERGV